MMHRGGVGCGRPCVPAAAAVPAAVDRNGAFVHAVVHAGGDFHPAADVGAECIANAFARPFFSHGAGAGKVRQGRCIAAATDE